MNLLLMNDLPGYGKVALGAAMPILSHYGYHVYNLPTALVSNTLNYGQYQMLDTTEYMKQATKVWENLGFSFDGVAAGFLLHEEQLAFVKGYCEKLQKQGAKVFVDPIMADHGKLYHGISQKQVELMRELCKSGDVIFPNYTEAAFLAGEPVKEGRLERAYLDELMKKLHGMGAKSVVITSIPMEEGEAVAGYDGQKGQSFFVPYTPVPKTFPGTGDIFSSVVMAKMMKEWNLEESVKAAVSILCALLERNIEILERYGEIALLENLELFR